VTHQDVCAYGRRQDELKRNGNTSEESIKHGDGDEDHTGSETMAFENLLDHSVDGVFLDLPEPWHVLSSAARVLRQYTGRIASYSPCIEQTQRMVESLSNYCVPFESPNLAGDSGNGQSGFHKKFHSIQTFEYRLREYHVDETVQLESIPAKGKRPSYNPNPNVPGAGSSDPSSEVPEMLENQGEPSEALLKSRERMEGDEALAPPSLLAASASYGPVVRPFGNMRGHTAYITIASVL
jgi:tRNA methyltransferase complex GCD14 subunit